MTGRVGELTGRPCMPPKIRLDADRLPPRLGTSKKRRKSRQGVARDEKRDELPFLDVISMQHTLSALNGRENAPLYSHPRLSLLQPMS